MKTYPKVLESFFNQPAAILPDKIADVQAFLESHAGLVPRGDSPPITAGPRDAGRYHITDGGIAFLSMMGVVAQRMNLMMEVSGGTSTEILGRSLDALVANRDVKQIVLVIDSPGGSVFGIDELAGKIYDARGKKKIIAVADSMAASAAYWIGAQASELVVTTGGMVGSIGVVAVHRDESQKEARAGVKTTLIHAGDYKTEGDPSQPLSSEGAAYVQRTVNEYYSMFLAAVARGRGVTVATVKKDFGQGRMLLAKEAVSVGMADRVASLDQVVERLNPSSRQSAVRAEAPDWLKAKLRVLEIHAQDDREASVRQDAPPAAPRAAGGRITREQSQRRADKVAAEVARDAAKDRVQND